MIREVIKSETHEIVIQNLQTYFLHKKDDINSSKIHRYLSLKKTRFHLKTDRRGEGGGGTKEEREKHIPSAY